MEFRSDFKPLEAGNLHKLAESLLDGGWRYVQILAVNKEDAVDLVYSFMKDGVLDNYVISDVARDAEVGSISDLYLEAFVCENEIHDLFGVRYRDIAIDFEGNFYRLATDSPMTIISPEQLAEREKMRRIAAAKAAKEAKAVSGADGAKGSASDDVEAKLEGMDPEKAAKVRAALAAKRKRESDAKLAAKLEEMDPEKAAKVSAALAAKRAKASGRSPVKSPKETTSSTEGESEQ